MLRKTISRFGMVSAGVAVGAIMAISPVFAQGTTPSSNSSTLLASILAAAEAAGVNAEQTSELLSVAAEINTQSPEPADVETEDEDELEDDDTAPAEAPITQQVTKHEVKVTTAAAVTKSTEESKSDD